MKKKLIEFFKKCILKKIISCLVTTTVKTIISLDSHHHLNYIEMKEFPKTSMHHKVEDALLLTRDLACVARGSQRPHRNNEKAQSKWQSDF